MKNELLAKNDLVKIFKKKGMLRLIYEFNMMPAGYAHKSWIEPVISNSFFVRTSNSKRVCKKTSKLILQYYGLNKDFFYDFSELKNRLALLPAEILNTLSLYGGIALNLKEIKTIIDKRKNKIIDTIGEKGLRFAIFGLPLLVGNLVPKTNKSIQWDDPIKFLQKCGQSFYLTAYANDPKQLYNRLLLKFPKDLEPDRNSFEYEIDPSSIGPFFIRIAKHVVDRRWQQLVF